jgi:hypothetical protein
MSTSGTYNSCLTKICSKCGLEKELTSFYNAKRGVFGKTAACKFCTDISTKSWTLKNKERHNNYNKKYRTKNKEKIKFFNIKFKYKISEEEYNALFEQQDGRCLGCNEHQSNLNKPLYIDHCHITKKVRGLLCHNCNTVLGFSKDNPEILQRLISYLKKD